MKNIKILLLLILVSITACTTREKRGEKYDNGNPKTEYQVVETDNGSFVKDGYYKKWDEDGQITEKGSYKDNKKSGEWITYYTSGNLKTKSNFENDLLDGLFESYDENGQLIGKGTFKKDKLDGKAVSYYSSGKIEEEINYKNGLQHGAAVEYYENGKKKSEGNYTNDEKDGMFLAWYKNGNKKYIRTYTLGKKNDTYSFYFENGQIQEEIQYENDEYHGSYKTWYEGGEKKINTTYTNGKKNGNYAEWKEDGSTVKKYTYEYGKNTSVIGDWLFKKQGANYTQSKITFYKSGKYIIDGGKDVDWRIEESTYTNDKIYFGTTEYILTMTSSDKFTISSGSDKYTFTKK